MNCVCCPSRHLQFELSRSRSNAKFFETSLRIRTRLTSRSTAISFWLCRYVTSCLRAAFVLTFVRGVSCSGRAVCGKGSKGGWFVSERIRSLLELARSASWLQLNGAIFRAVKQIYEAKAKSVCCWHVLAYGSDKKSIQSLWDEVAWLLQNVQLRERISYSALF